MGHPGVGDRGARPGQPGSCRVHGCCGDRDGSGGAGAGAIRPPGRPRWAGAGAGPAGPSPCLARVGRAQARWAPSPPRAARHWTPPAESTRTAAEGSGGRGRRRAQWFAPAPPGKGEPAGVSHWLRPLPRGSSRAEGRGRAAGCAPRPLRPGAVEPAAFTSRARSAWPSLSLCRRAPSIPPRWSPRPWLACEYRGCAAWPRAQEAFALRCGGRGRSAAESAARGLLRAGGLAEVEGRRPRARRTSAAAPAGRAAAGMPGPLCPSPRW